MEKADATTTDIKITPISHASFVMHMGGQVIYNDPVGGEKAYSGQDKPTMILLSDIHQDHFDIPTLKSLSTKDVTMVVPQAVADELPPDVVSNLIIMKNGESQIEKGIEIEAIPMYNIPESSSAFHTKGRGNGYVLSNSGKRVYIAGDTGPIPEMLRLKNIDIAFIPMNLPYTMSVEDAASAVAEFKPKVVHPYHYKGLNGFSDINNFKKLVESKDPSIKVDLLNFYP